MSIWSLQQNERLNKVNFNDNILPPPTTDEYCGTSDECSPPQHQKKTDDDLEVHSKQKINERSIKSLSYL